ncbi:MULTISPECIES: hypothetical protein [unclassified Nocardia]|uniref:hypothetical protein n=1 Tax=unclassified Nocardia TaxID=2637762 RepID=UPI002E1CBB40|nr:hypothetical protein OHA42_31630 [Nocardia sp. NBC_01009]
MTTKIASTLAAIAITLLVGTAAAPAASAEPVTPAPTPALGSVAFCFNIPLGVFSFSICI